VGPILGTDLGRATITDVADRSGVSRSTVSRYLNGFKVARQAAIELAIADLGYQPSRVARSLKSGSTHAIGVIVPDISNPFFAAAVKGMESLARECGYQLLLCNTDEDVDLERAALDELMVRSVDGLVLTTAARDLSEVPSLRSLPVPISLLDRTIDGLDHDSVLVDNPGGSRQAIQHLFQLGHRRIALITGPTHTTPGRGRYEGFVDALAEFGIQLPEEYVQQGGFREEGGYQAALRLVGTQPRPSAIYAGNNLMAIGALKALHELGVTIPGEMSFVSFDDLQLAPLISPPPTVIARPTSEQGVLAMQLLLDRLSGNGDRPSRKIVLDTSLLVRGSTGPPFAERSSRTGRRL
jgi:LacI family transcriptional regulator